jgi:hypothetical protein
MMSHVTKLNRNNNTKLPELGYTLLLSQILESMLESDRYTSNISYSRYKVGNSRELKHREQAVV